MTNAQITLRLLIIIGISVFVDLWVKYKVERKHERIS